MPLLSSGRAIGSGMLLMASFIVGCMDAVLTATGEGQSRRLSQAVAKIFRRRGAMGRSPRCVTEDLGRKRRQFSGPFEESSFLR